MTKTNEEWGESLRKYISATEERVAKYKRKLQEGFKNKIDREKLLYYRERQRAEEKWLKFLRFEKQCWNEGRWERALFEKDI